MTVAVEVTVGGRPPGGGAQVLTVRVASRLALPAQCEVTLDPGGAGSGWAGSWPLGDELVVRVAGAGEPLFEGEVTCVELVRAPDGTGVTRIRGYDRLHRLRKRQQARVFESLTVAGLAEALAGDLGLRVDAPEEGPRVERLVQHRQHDLGLLVEAAGRAGLYPVVRGDALRLVTLEGSGDPVKLHYGQSLWEARIEANLDRVAGSYRALGWHPQRAEPIEQRAGAPRSGRRVALHPGPGDARVDGDLLLVDQPGRGADELSAAAQAALDASAARAVVLHGVADGDTGLWAGGLVEVSGIADEADGRYVLTEAVHTVDGAGWSTRLSTAPPAAEPVPPGASITLGRVSDVDDPQKLGRVRVSLPGYGDTDAGWLGVLCPGAGQGRGIVALPDVDDTVLVALPHGVPAAGVVLGSLYGTVEPPDAGVDGGAVRRWSLHTADGQSVVVDDDKHSIRLRDKGGSFVELTPDLVRMHANTDLTVEAPGHAMTLRANTIDFVQATGEESGG
jgi:phage baseplate assembly protein gpV/phage protein D